MVCVETEYLCGFSSFFIHYSPTSRAIESLFSDIIMIYYVDGEVSPFHLPSQLRNVKSIH